MKLPISFTKVTKLSKIIALLLFIALPFLGFVLGMKYQKKIAVDSYKTYEEVKNNKLHQDKLVNDRFGGFSKEELISRGIHPDAVNIKIIENVTAQWQDKGVAYELEKVYLTPDIADLGSARNNANLKDKSFLIAELSVRDRRTSGERRLIPAGGYVRVRVDKEDYNSIISDYLYLSPQENETVYVTFPVERNTNQFNLLIGVLSNPRVIRLDFGSSDVNIMRGVFIRKEGYFPEYSYDLHP